MRIPMRYHLAASGVVEMSSPVARTPRESFPPSSFFVSPTTSRSSPKSDLRKTLAILDEVLTLLEDSDDNLEDP